MGSSSGEAGSGFGGRRRGKRERIRGETKKDCAGRPATLVGGPRVLRIPVQLDRSLYRRDDSIVHESLREAVVNALIHADHWGQGGVMMERYPDRIEVSNPGTLLMQ
jgi:hypothetical protein